MTSFIQRKKTEKFLEIFLKDIDDDLLALALKVHYLGEDKEKLDKLIEQHQKEMDEYSKQFEIEDVSKVIMSEEEKQEILKSKNKVEDGNSFSQ
ncbi:MAG: hypothetical protein EBR82_34315 [Caulobacteraceae bacterium]|nr:hypothetical protein [Caulobacteraceae bacterium]